MARETNWKKNLYSDGRETAHRHRLVVLIDHAPNIRSEEEGKWESMRGGVREFDSATADKSGGRRDVGLVSRDVETLESLGGDRPKIETICAFPFS
jgi:hypothetical protein